MEEFAQGFLADRTMAAFSTNQIEEEAERVAQQKRELEMKRKRLKDRNSTIAIELEMRCQAFAELHQEMKAAIGLIAQRTKLQEVESAQQAAQQALQQEEAEFRKLQDLWVFRQGKSGPKVVYAEKAGSKPMLRDEDKKPWKVSPGSVFSRVTRMPNGNPLLLEEG